MNAVSGCDPSVSTPTAEPGFASRTASTAWVTMS
jgi:hypothetical protein